MKFKSIKHFVQVANAYLDFTESTLKATKTFINSPKLIAVLEEVDGAIKESIKNTLTLHKEDLVAKHDAFEAAMKGEEEKEETTH
jgi:hypothetical protein